MFSLLCISLLLSGCVYLRLLETKHQMAEFDRNFRVDAGQHFTVHFLRPTLLSDDFTELSGIEPTWRRSVGSGKVSHYAFRKIDANGNITPSPAGDLIFELAFNHEDRLVSWDFSPAFLAMAPAAFLEASLRSLGHASINQSKRRVSANPADLRKVAAEVPSRAAIVSALGQPLAVTDHPDGTLYIYRFRLDGRAVDEDHEKNRFADAKLYFDPQTGRLTKMSCRFAGLKISINYRRLAESA